jgi:hypothetical protein
MDGAHPAVDPRPMTTSDRQIHAIAARHQADAEESFRTCRACGRPWPCDVTRLVDAYASRDRAPAIAAVAASATTRVSHHRARRSHAPRVHATV